MYEGIEMEQFNSKQTSDEQRIYNM